VALNPNASPRSTSVIGLIHSVLLTTLLPNWPKHTSKSCLLICAKDLQQCKNIFYHGPINIHNLHNRVPQSNFFANNVYYRYKKKKVHAILNTWITEHTFIRTIDTSIMEPHPCWQAITKHVPNQNFYFRWHLNFPNEIPCTTNSNLLSIRICT
jgi:hypothetical protein